LPEVGPYRPEIARERALWEHVALCPGVALLVRMDADTEARRLVAEIEARYVKPAPPPS
jgi:hypothetical protein